MMEPLSAEPTKTQTRKGYPRLSSLENIMTRVDKCLDHIKPDLERVMKEDPTNRKMVNIQDRFIVVIANGLAGCCTRSSKTCGLPHAQWYCRFMLWSLENETPGEAASKRWIASVACSALASFRYPRNSWLESPLVTYQEDLYWRKLPAELNFLVLSHMDHETRRAMLMVSKAWNNELSLMSLYGIAIKFVRKFRRSLFTLNFDLFCEVLRRCTSLLEGFSPNPPKFDKFICC